MNAAISRFLEEHPLTEQVDVILPDLAGVGRCKRVPAGALAGALRGEAFFTTSLYTIDTTGWNVDHALVWDGGDQDRPVALDAGTLRPIPWRPGAAQILGGLADHDGSPFFADPRAIVAALERRLLDRGLTPVAALELEFHLLDAENGADGRPLVPRSARLGGRGIETDVFAPERMEEQEPFLALVEQYAAAQGLTLKGSLAEYGPAQFEINLGHGADMVRAADAAFMLKRCVKAAARATGQRATFMAKPFAEQSGSGLHVHLSLVDAAGGNLLGEPGKGDALMRRLVGGMQATMAEAMLVLAPNANSYRRLRPLSYAPTAATWGVNNRTVALRVPPGPAAARRVEHRVAGADANPYLVLAVVLAGALHGLEHGLEPDEPVRGNAYDERRPSLPLGWDAAINAFRRAQILPAYLGAAFCDLYAANRESERDRFGALISPTEHAWYLTTV